MRIKRVTAHAFGPLRDATLELAPGLTVIYGRNESAKSTWHAAIHAALCGRRRGAGATARDRDFADRHRPWDHEGWLVSAEIQLADGRRVELRQDLDRRVDCHARDLDLGTDLSAEIMNDGTPDAARWLGLDRRSFEATAFVPQARMLDVLKDADGLQSHLQRAAATAGADATAAGALRRIDVFRAEHVGRAQANSIRPLQRAIVAHRAATARLAGARTRHSDDEQRQVQLQALRAQAAAAQERLRRREAADLFARAETAEQRAAEAAALQERLAVAGAADPVTDVEVAAALAALAARAGVPVAPPVDTAVGGVADHELW
jgi:exonuclease SbcC